MRLLRIPEPFDHPDWPAGGRRLFELACQLTRGTAAAKAAPLLLALR